MQTKKSSVVIGLLAVNLALSVIILAYLFIPYTGAEAEDDIGGIPFYTLMDGRHVLYIGLNDRYTYYQIIPTEEAVEIVTEIVARHVSGWTMSMAQGGWIDEHGILTQEYSMVWTFIGAEEEDIRGIMREVLVALNQNSILVERSDVTSVFYRGR
ncbi:MAG: hypothetical protein FWB91_03220 [Defluviitaleaceae bacterium]|nr:hypothetical protein [Defluviitaleaceae bacterium]